MKKLSSCSFWDMTYCFSKANVIFQGFHLGKKKLLLMKPIPLIGWLDDYFIINVKYPIHL
jgi:hypothetical protein